MPMNPSRRKLRARRMTEAKFPDRYRGFGANDKAIQSALAVIEKDIRTGNFEGALAWLEELNRHLKEKHRLIHQKARAERKLSLEKLKAELKSIEQRRG
tara:strand:- start:927 stop:1223 length:297 start_codon:yes stop_codon:yes gene_type:complete